MKKVATITGRSDDKRPPSASTSSTAAMASLGSSLSCALVASAVLGVLYMVNSQNSNGLASSKAKMYLSIGLGVVCLITVIVLVIWLVIYLLDF